MRRSPMMDFSLIRASALWPQKKQMTQFVPIPIAFILLTLFRVFANVDVTEYRMLKQTEDYNELIPPSNPKFPWKPDWEPLCYYCAHHPIDKAMGWSPAACRLPLGALGRALHMRYRQAAPDGGD